jgi:hypothetical protein
VAEGAPLLREYGVCSLIEGSNPSFSAIFLIMNLFFYRSIIKNIEEQEALMRTLVRQNRQERF